LHASKNILFFFIVTLSACKHAETDVKVDANNLSQYVNPFIGTGGYVQGEPGMPADCDTILNKKATYPFGGLVFPGATVPFGMIQLSPDCNYDNRLGWSAGYHYSDTSMLGFSHMHTSGNGLSLGHFLFLPVVSPDSLKAFSYLKNDTRQVFNHANETATAGYYAVKFSNSNIKAELTATTRLGVQRYSFDAADNASVIINLVHAIGNYGNVADAQLTVQNDTVVSGYRITNDSIKTYFKTHFSAPIKSAGLYNGYSSVLVSKAISGKQVKALLSFGKLSTPLVVRTAISFTSVEGAEKNMQAESLGNDFDKYVAQAKTLWDNELQKVILREGNKDDVVKFYTALYHSCLTPFELNDADGSFMAGDGAVLKTKGFKNYTFFSLWDTYRTLHPLHTLLQPDRVNDMMQSMVVQALYSKEHALPMWCLAAKNFGNMAGHSVVIVLAEAYAKGFKNFDAKQALQLLKANLNNGNYVGYADYVQYGYLPCDMYKASVPRTLEYAFSDWNVGKLCALLGDKDSTLYFNRSNNYKNVFHSASGFMRPRYKNGTWKEPFDARRVSHHLPTDDYMESNAWQYNWLVMQDVPGFIQLMGGSKAFVTKLDSLFMQPSVFTGSYAADVSGVVGQYVQGNQPDHHVPYLYSLANEPAKAQFRIKQIADSLYKNSPDGLSGNDDGGEMSAWLVFSSLGFYPLNPASGYYIIGTPLFSYAEIKTSGARKFVIEANRLSDKNMHIQSATLNGKPFNNIYLTHMDIVKGGKLVYNMGPAPSAWGKNL